MRSKTTFCDTVLASHTSLPMKILNGDHQTHLHGRHSRFYVELNMRVDDIDPPLSGWVEPMLCRVAAMADITSGSLNVAITNDSEMRLMHWRYKGQRCTTDVLTFDLRDGGSETSVEGDLLICLDEAVRQAAIYGHDVRAEVLLYAVHGLLHLTGYDDDTSAACSAMHQREDELLMAVGLEAVYGRHATG